MSATAASREEQPGRGFGSERCGRRSSATCSSPRRWSSTVSSSSIRSATRSTSAATTGASSARSRRRLRELPRAVPRRALRDRDQERRSSSRSRSRSSQMALGLCVAVIVNNAIRFRGVLPFRLLLPVDRLVGGDHRGRALHSSPRTGCSTRSPASTARGSGIGNGPLGDRRPELLDDLGHDDALLPRLPAGDPDRRLRGGGDRRRRRVANVLEDHLPPAQAGHFFVSARS